MKGFRHTVLALALAAALAASCGPRVIPRGKLSDIYVEMFLTDQWLRENPSVNRTADTLLVYEPIFKRHGYSTDDYLRSQEYYLRDPDRYAKLLRGVSRKLDKERQVIQKQIDKEDYLSGLHLGRVSVADSLLATFRKTYAGRPRVIVDSLFRLRLADFSSDTVYEGPRMIVWSDTLLRDTLAVDSLALADSLQLDSLAKTHDIMREVTDSGEVFVGRVPVRRPHPRPEIFQEAIEPVDE